MSSNAVFVLSAVALLSTPGPTNTLLAISSASVGFTKSLRLLPAEVLGYSISITILTIAAGLIGSQQPVIGVAMRLIACVYLIHTSWALWRNGGRIFNNQAQIGFRNVFVTTVLNPKNLLFTFGIVPFAGSGQLDRAAPYIACLMLIVTTVAACWLSLGAAMRIGMGSIRVGVLRRGGAFVLATFAVLIFYSAFLPQA